ncbi:hypothetical protein HZS_6281, partial [Henneguya salminicola]
MILKVISSLIFIHLFIANNSNLYSNTWAIQYNSANITDLKQILKNQGFRFLNQVGSSNVYVVKNENILDIENNRLHEITNSLLKNNKESIRFGSILRQNLSIQIIGQIESNIISAFLFPKNPGLSYIIFFDQHAIHERIILENILNKYRINIEEACFRNITCKICTKDLKIFQKYPMKLCPGINCCVDSKNRINFKIPKVLQKYLEQKTENFREEFIKNTLEDCRKQNNYNFFKNIPIPKTVYSFFQSISCQTAIKFGKRLNHQKMHNLISELKHCIKWAEQQSVFHRFRRYDIPNDPYFKDMWYLLNSGQSSGPAGVDIDVIPVWKQNITGRGVVISDPIASYDFNDHDPDPKPRDEDPDNCHGTRCAGEAASVGNNGICGLGVAYNAKIGGVRMLDGSATDALEASSLSFKNDYIDIYINCWGPKDDGKTFGKPGPLAMRALKEGAEKGRKGKGSLFVWATGNGGLTDDDCNCDGYTTSIYTISIGCIGDHGLSAYYTEKCSSTIAVTFNGASHKEGKENKMVTTDLYHQCTSEFKGTSASAPIAAGILALVLEINPSITWRDAQHLIVRSAKVTSPMDDGWKTNSAGFHYNHKFGFGRLVASNIVEMAKTWKNVSPQKECVGYNDQSKKNIPVKNKLEINFETEACSKTENVINSLEHVVLTISLVHHRRGSISIDLISPTGSPSQILSTRRYDTSEEGLDEWNFMSVHFWGENPKGKWKLIINDNIHPTKIGPDENDNEDLAERLIDRDVERQKPTWDSMRQQNPYFETDYPTGVRKNKITRDKKFYKKKSKSYSPLPGMMKNNKNFDTLLSEKNKIKELTGIQRVQVIFNLYIFAKVSAGYDNPKVDCVDGNSCS